VDDGSDGLTRCQGSASLQTLLMLQPAQRRSRWGRQLPLLAWNDPGPFWLLLLVAADGDEDRESGESNRLGLLCLLLGDDLEPHATKTASSSYIQNPSHADSARVSVYPLRAR